MAHCNQRVRRVSILFAQALFAMRVSMPAGAAAQPAAPPFDFQAAARNVPKPRAIWPLVRRAMVPLEFTILRDEVGRIRTRITSARAKRSR